MSQDPRQLFREKLLSPRAQNFADHWQRQAAEVRPISSGPWAVRRAESMLPLVEQMSLPLAINVMQSLTKDQPGAKFVIYIPPQITPLTDKVAVINPQGY